MLGKKDDRQGHAPWLKALDKPTGILLRRQSHILEKRRARPERPSVCVQPQKATSRSGPKTPRYGASRPDVRKQAVRSGRDGGMGHLGQTKVNALSLEGGETPCLLLLKNTPAGGGPAAASRRATNVPRNGRCPWP